MFWGEVTEKKFVMARRCKEKVDVNLVGKFSRVLVAMFREVEFRWRVRESLTSGDAAGAKGVEVVRDNPVWS